MKVLVIHPHLHFLGGSEVLTKILVYGLEEQGYEVVVLSKDFREDLFKPTPKVTLERFRIINEEDSIKARLINVIHTLDEVFRKHGELLPFIMIQEPPRGWNQRLARKGGQPPSHLTHSTLHLTSQPAP